MPIIDIWIRDEDYSKYLVVKAEGKGAVSNFMHRALTDLVDSTNYAKTENIKQNPDGTIGKINNSKPASFETKPGKLNNTGPKIINTPEAVKKIFPDAKTLPVTTTSPIHTA